MEDAQHIHIYIYIDKYIHISLHKFTYPCVSTYKCGTTCLFRICFVHVAKVSPPNQLNNDKTSPGQYSATRNSQECWRRLAESRASQDQEGHPIRSYAPAMCPELVEDADMACGTLMLSSAVCTAAGGSGGQLPKIPRGKCAEPSHFDKAMIPYTKALSMT